jgi:hypothetical protein
MVPYMNLKKSTLVLQLFVLFSSPWANAVTSVCTRDEVVYFSCQTDKGILSLCGSKKGSKVEGIQVKLGTIGSLKFKYPNSMDGSIKSFKYSRYTRPLVTDLKISFESDNVDYELYRDSSYEENPKKENWAAGLNKISGDDVEDLAACGNYPYSRFAELEDILENKDFLE